MFEALSRASISDDSEIDDFDLEYVTYKVRPTKDGGEKKISIGDPIFIDTLNTPEKFYDPYQKYSDTLTTIYSLEMIKNQMENFYKEIHSNFESKIANRKNEDEVMKVIDIFLDKVLLKDKYGTALHGIDLSILERESKKTVGNFCNQWKFCGIVEQISTDFMKNLNIKAKVSGIANIKKKHVRKFNPGNILTVTATRSQEDVVVSGIHKGYRSTVNIEINEGYDMIEVAEKINDHTVDVMNSIIYIGKIGHMIKKRPYSVFENEKDEDVFGQIFLG